MEDKKTIGIADGRTAVLDLMVEEGNFGDAIEAAKFAMGLAIREGAGVGMVNPSVEGANTKWNVGSFDPNNDLQTLLSALYPDVETPYRLLEYLINDGLRLVSFHVEAAGVFDVTELLPADEATEP